MVSLMITFGTVLYTYLSLSLPKEAYNAFDALVVPEWVVQKGLPANGADLDWRGTKRRNLATLTSFILTMSDQHLVTGTAMLITSWAIALGAGGLDQKRSVYSLRVATSLATLAAIAHITTLFVLRFRFRGRTADVDVRIVTLFVLTMLTFGARLRSSSTSSQQDCQPVANSSVKEGLLESQDQEVNTRVAATIMEMLGLWICMHRSLKVYFQEGGLRSIVRWCILSIRGRELTRSDWERIQESHDQRLRRGLYSRLLFTIMTLSSSSLVEILWLLLFFVYGLVELCLIYARRLNYDKPDVVVEPSFGQLMPILVLSGSVLGILTTWIGRWLVCHCDLPLTLALTEIHPAVTGTPSLKNRFRNWIVNVASRRRNEDAIDLDFVQDQVGWNTLRGHTLLVKSKDRKLAWVVFFIGITAMTAVVLARIVGTTYPDTLTVGNHGFIWNCLFIAGVGLYLSLHILSSVVLGIRDAAASSRR